ncbi:AMP-binding protein [Kibdelosporangium philippinense]|uniref:AMP-binding protein n=1 Tax=Kibdelosporangium philippinense TaxID=211113 RepID=A0ABS8Z938_9PSEU|nr:AMP-binding protein [Kibdelosporangium philippinense]MCE7002367.1 AMP-binding protein [Kibdelosporangium philippinense]
MKTESSSNNYVGAVLRGIGDDPDRIVIHQADGRTVRAAELIDLIHRTAHVLRDRGVRRGSTVSIMSGNRVEVLTIRYATNLLGARSVSLYEGMSAETLAVIAADVETDILVTDKVDALPKVKDVLTFGPSTAGADLLALVEQAPSTPIPVEPVRADEIWSVRHTGGTTGHPKGILRAFGTYAARWSDAANPAEPPVFLACTTLAHVAGTETDRALGQGGSVVLHPRFDPVKALADIERHRVTDSALMPPLLYQLTDQMLREPVDTSSLRNVAYGGCASSPDRIAQAVAVFGAVFTQVYGQLEAGFISALSPEDHLRYELLGTAGRALPGVEIRILAEDGSEVKQGESGEICVRTPSASAGYLNNPELSAQVWRDGLVHTGDVGFLDEEAYLHINGRVRDMVIVLGGHVYPTEVEDVLLSHPAVAAAAVFGVRDADSMEQVEAALVLRPGATIDLDAVRSLVTTHMGAQYAPSGITVLDAIPLTDVGKPDKQLLRASWRAGISGGQPVAG